MNLIFRCCKSLGYVDATDLKPVVSENTDLQTFRPPRSQRYSVFTNHLRKSALFTLHAIFFRSAPLFGLSWALLLLSALGLDEASNLFVHVLKKPPSAEGTHGRDQDVTGTCLLMATNSCPFFEENPLSTKKVSKRAGKQCKEFIPASPAHFLVSSCSITFFPLLLSRPIVAPRSASCAAMAAPHGCSAAVRSAEPAPVHLATHES